LAAGATDFLLKPLELREVMDVVRKLLADTTRG
jgi:FixJ family two-component response regulator